MADAHQNAAPPGLNVTDVFIVDDDMFVRKTLAELLPTFGDLRIKGVFDNGADAVAAAAADPPDVILMDIAMPGMDGIEATGLISRGRPAIRILALTSMADQNMVSKMYDAGAVGYLFKDTPVEAMVSAIAAVRQGLAVMSPGAKPQPPADQGAVRPKLNPTEAEILKLVCQGLTNQQIAERVSNGAWEAQQALWASNPNMGTNQLIGSNPTEISRPTWCYAAASSVRIPIKGIHPGKKGINLHRLYGWVGGGTTTGPEAGGEADGVLGTAPRS